MEDSTHHHPAAHSHEHVHSNSNTPSEDLLIKERAEKVLSYFKSHYSWISYIGLFFIALFAYWIRTRNLAGLRDVTTGDWTLGPDLDPFLFLRYAQEIVEHGTLPIMDYMRNVPLGFINSGELNLLSYMIVWFHKFALIFGSTSLNQSAVFFPAVMFFLTVIAFFLFVRKTFSGFVEESKSNIIALIASIFLSIIPSLLPRTIAGIPEKESVGFLFMFLAFYFFLSSWESKNNSKGMLLAALSGISSALMGLVWGGYVYVFLTLGATTIIYFFLGQVDFQRSLRYSIWLGLSVLMLQTFTTRYPLQTLITSSTTMPAFMAFGLIILYKIIKLPYIHSRISSIKSFGKLPLQVQVLIIFIVLGAIFSSLLYGISFIPEQIDHTIQTLVNPSSSRFSLTVAENRQPFFSEWANSFGPLIKIGQSYFPVFFWLFFVGSIYIFYHLITHLDLKNKVILTSTYLIYLLCIIFSRYRSDSILNGTNSLSIFLYFAGVAVLLGAFGFIYIQYFRKGDEDRFKQLHSGVILLFVFFFLSIVSARGAVRTIMVLVPPVAAIVSYFLVDMVHNALPKKGEVKLFAILIASLIILLSFYSGYKFYQETIGTAKQYVPSVYTQQWQYAMSWVRDNTPKEAVFGHWWDYGYWVQTMGQRATVLDGGNAIVYWNHLMGRYGLTGRNNTQALEFLYTHNTTHFLIDSSDIGKYGAFSSIGSDENFDRSSWMPTFVKDVRQTQETKNTTIFVYSGGSGLDGDLTYFDNGTRIFIPSSRGGIIAVVLELNKNGSLFKSPVGIFIDSQGKQSPVPLRYAYKDKKLLDFGKGLEAGVFLMDRALITSQGQASMDYGGALLYLSNKTVMGQLARLYLYDEKNGYFNLVHTEDDYVVKQLKLSNATQNDFIFYDSPYDRSLRGPIKIWEISYPSNMQSNPEFLRTTYPDLRLLS